MQNQPAAVKSQTAIPDITESGYNITILIFFDYTYSIFAYFYLILQ